VNVIRGTLRFGVVVALIGWMVVIAIPIVFSGGGVRNLSFCADDPSCGAPPWGAIGVVGIVVILAIGFLTRFRARR
jgi:hypothetical protein